MMVTKFYRRLAFQSLLLVSCAAAMAQDKPTVAPSIKTFALQPDMTGAAANSVNLFTGTVVLPLNLVTLPGHNGLDAGVAISYSSQVDNAVKTWNMESPAGILGLGWSMDIPKIITDHKQTGTREDDEYYLVQGGSSSHLVRTSSGYDATGGYYAYELKSYQFWKIKYYYDVMELYGSPNYGSGPNKWVITKEDGTQYVYGDKNSGRNTVQYMVRWENWIGNSAQTNGQSQLAYIWNLSEVIDVWNEKLTYEYETVEQFTGSSVGKKHTEASYLKQITDVFGRKIQFFYNDKDPQFYAEPHTERAEPDAYQEFYEKKYLSRIDVLRETGNKLLSIEFGYGTINGGTSTAKMMLTSIVQKNSNGGALPGIQLSYNTGGNVAGRLQTITYPTGGSISYTYSGHYIAHSNRQFIAYAPPGYAEPKVWLGEDYAVVVWRELGSGNSHDDNPRGVKLYAYQWVGEWKEVFLQSIGNIRLEGATAFKDYKDFQVVVQKDFFGVLVPSGSGNYYHMFLLNKDPSNRGQWGYYSATIDYGSGVPKLLSGDHFVAVASYQDDGTHPCHLYTFQGNGWRDDVLNQTIGDHYYTSANNYFISHNRSGVNGTEMNFNYLSEDRKWVTKNWPYSWLLFGSNDPSYWYGSNSFAVVMADDNPEYVYRWDLTYTNFYRDSKDKNNNDLFGGLPDQASVYIVNNDMVGINGHLARWDGTAWSTDFITSTHNSPFGDYYSYGDDYVVRPSSFVSSTSNYRGARKVFDPNQLNWQPDYIMDGSDRGQDFAYAGIDYYYFGNGYYYRQSNGNWIKKYTFPSTAYHFAIGGYPRFDVWYDYYPFPIQELRSFKNGEMANPLWLGGNLLYSYTKYKSMGVGNQTIVAYSAAVANPQDATYLQLSRLVNDEVSGDEWEYPVTMITTNDGTANRYTTIDYNYTTAVSDPNGGAMYNEVTVIPGSTSASSTPYGYTKTFFHNGLTAYELGTSEYLPVDYLWCGAPYATKVYDNNNNLLSSSKTSLTTFARNILNGDGTKVESGFYVRPTQVSNMTDGVETVNYNSYDNNTGLLTQSIQYDHDSKNSYTLVRYKYFWEQYDATRAMNILSPVIQVKKSVVNTGGETVTGVSAVTWKNWNNVYAPHKTYQWRRTGSSDFDFASWSDAGEPSTGWMKVSQVDALDAAGNVVQMTNR